MARKPDYERMTLFERLKQGLEDAIAHARGELKLRTTTLPYPPRAVSRWKLRALRRKLRMSRFEFSATLNVPYKQVERWELGRGKPEGGTLRLIELIGKKPELVGEIFGDDRATRRIHG